MQKHLNPQINLLKQRDRGRHPNAYHDYMLNSIRKIDNVASGNQSVFLSGFSDLKKEIINNPEMLRKGFWKR